MYKKLIRTVLGSLFYLMAFSAQANDTRATVDYINEQCSNVGNIAAFLEQSRRDLNDPNATIDEMADAFLGVIKKQNPKASQSEMNLHKSQTDAAVRLWKSNWEVLVAMPKDYLPGYAVGACVKNGIDKLIMKR